MKTTYYSYSPLKLLVLLIFSAVLGSIFTMSTKLLSPDKMETVKVEHISETPIVGASYQVNEHNKMVPLDFTGVAKKVMPTVVHIKATQIQQNSYSQNRNPYHNFHNDDIFEYFFGPNFRQYGQPQQQAPKTKVGTGSGVIIDANGYIVTNNHVIDNADDIEVTLHDNEVYKAKVIGSDPSTDLALIQIKKDKLPFLPLVNSDEVEVGEWVLAVGNPFNLNSTVTAGIVSAKGRSINILQDQSAIESFIQTDAAINPGNSGGALVDLSGGLIGINTAIASPTGAYAGYGFAVPANIVSKVIHDLRTYGMVQRGYLGLIIRNVDGNLAKERDLQVTEGVYIEDIAENSAAGEAGVEKGDVIVGINQKPVKTNAHLLELVGQYNPGDKVLVEVNRKGKTKEFEVILRNQEGKESLSEKDDNILETLGVELESLDNKTCKRLGIKSGVKIIKMYNGILNKQTSIKTGFIIVKLDGENIESVEDISEILKNKKGGVMLEGMYEDYPGYYYYAFGL